MRRVIQKYFVSFKVPAIAVGVMYALVTVLVWGMQPVVIRLSVHQGLTATDMTVLRFIPAAFCLLPIAVRRRPFPVGALGWKRAIVLALLSGAPYNFVLVSGAAYAPAVDAASILSGIALLITAMLAVLFANERFTAIRGLALVITLTGILPFTFQSAWEGWRAGTELWRGHALFALTGCMWATVTVLSKRWKVDPWDFVASQTILSAFTLPFWVDMSALHILQVSLGVAIFQAVYVGLLVGVVSLVCFQRAIAQLGPTNTSMFFALVPFIAWIGGRLVLGEEPSLAEIAGVLLVILGLSIAPYASRSAAAIPAAVAKKP